ncbi:MAG TPA: DNA polymerase III subunit delta' [Steroidobacteraceae bacterium]|nr:DNA polymerase III subunit delta' [Steroidobacteraceae bacterium]
MNPPWLSPALQSLRAAYATDRMPHALLIHDSPGAGGDWLAQWAASLVLCTNPAEAPCGRCDGCRRVAADQHPDLTRVVPIEDSKQLRIEQVRDLASELALTSHQGGYKVGILSPADTLNRFAANALLKTLEEPPVRTLLILVATQPSRLPPTILSRCQRLRVRAPTRAEAIAWLEQTKGKADWGGVLDVIGEAPFWAAAEGDPKAIPALGQETRRTLEDIAAGEADPVATAERWSRSEPALRLRCFENWLTDRIRRQSGASGHSVEMRPAPHLPRPAPILNIRSLFELVDGVRGLRFMLDEPINRSLAIEMLLRQLAGQRN